MTTYEQAKGDLARRIARALPISLGFGRSEFLKRKREQAEQTAQLQRDIAAIRREAQQTAMRLYLLVRDCAPSPKNAEDDLPLVEDAR